MIKTKNNWCEGQPPVAVHQ